MKKQFIFALMSGIALSGAVTFSACSSSSEEVIDNPDYNPETNSVKAQFAISLQDNVLNAKTRMSADNVQQGGTLAQFKGITDMKLLPFNAATISSSSTLNGSVISLTPDIDATNTGTATEKVKVFSNVDIQAGTNRFLFYGHAKTGTEGFEHGALKTPTDYSTLNSITFTPKPINESITTTGTEYTVCTKLLELMSAVANAKTGTTTWGPAGTGETQTAVVALQSMYNQFVRINAGSSQMVKDALEDIYNELNTMATTSTDPGYALAGAIRTAILASNANTVTGTAGSQVLSLGSAYQGYPGNLNLPDGAAQIQWDATNKVFTDVSLNGSGSVTALTKYAYPANLQYFVNSSIKTQTSKVLDESKSWTDNLAQYNDANASTVVTASTRSVALVDLVQYGVGRLDLTIKCESATLKDNLGNNVTMNAANGFPVSAIIIGGQKAVDYSFSNPSGDAYTIYDKTVTGVNAKTTAEGKNYTLILESAPSTNVNVAVELTNNTGADFYGKDGQVIPKDGKFYLTATLEASAATQTDKKVFKQDYYTEVNLTIKTGSTGNVGLGAATNTLPDLRVPTMELGFSVDMTWQAGQTFNVEI